MERFRDSLRNTVNVPFTRVLFALGIRGVGESGAKDIATHFGDIDSLIAAGKEQIMEVPDIGEITAETVYAFFRDQRHIIEIERLRAHGLKFSMQEKQHLSAALDGKSIVISGNFSISREEMKALIELHGGKNSTSVSSKTDYLLAGNKPGPEKLKKAEQLGVAVISEDEFRALIPGGIPGIAENKEELTLF